MLELESSHLIHIRHIDVQDSASLTSHNKTYQNFYRCSLLLYNRILYEFGDKIVSQTLELIASLVDGT